MKRSYYEPIYPPSRIRRVDMEGNCYGRSTALIKYNDPVLCEYIVRKIEMLFREKIGYKKVSYPTELKGALRVKFADGYQHILSEDDTERERELKYISLYDEIGSIIINGFNTYTEKNVAEINRLKEEYSCFA